MERLEAIFYQLAIVIQENQKLIEMILALEQQTARPWKALEQIRFRAVPYTAWQKARLETFSVLFSRAHRYLRSL